MTTSILPLREFSEKFVERAKIVRWHVIDTCSNDRKGKSMVPTLLPKLQLPKFLAQIGSSRKLQHFSKHKSLTIIELHYIEIILNHRTTFSQDCIDT
jgi:hypothetical protein